MDVKICKWYKNVKSPVLFMIDDLANTWIDINKNGVLDEGEDWGFFKYSDSSSMKYLENEILSIDDKIKVTFFVPVGKRVGILKDSENVISYPINYDNESKKFFKTLHNNPRYEIAYHGTTHGIAKDSVGDFQQEWETYNSLDEALTIIEEGKKIYRDAIGEEPLGGKYCGYTSNKYSDDSILKSNFLWWCRYCNLETIKAAKSEYNNKYIFGEDLNPITNYDIKFFGHKKVIDIPTTVNGGMLSTIYNYDCFFIKAFLKKILVNYLRNKKLKYIEYLFNNKLVISIQEHISPARDDGKIQTPNIFNDKDSLLDIFRYLKRKNVWYCTCSELASYIYNRENLKILIIGEKEFKINYSDLKIKGFNYITLEINKEGNVITPLGRKIDIDNNIITIPLEDGIYRLS